LHIYQNLNRKNLYIYSEYTKNKPFIQVKTIAYFAGDCGK